MQRSYQDSRSAAGFPALDHLPLEPKVHSRVRPPHRVLAVLILAVAGKRNATFDIPCQVAFRETQSPFNHQRRPLSSLDPLFPGCHYVSDHRVTAFLGAACLPAAPRLANAGRRRFGFSRIWTWEKPSRPKRSLSPTREGASIPRRPNPSKIRPCAPDDPVLSSDRTSETDETDQTDEIDGTDQIDGTDEIDRIDETDKCRHPRDELSQHS